MNNKDTEVVTGFYGSLICNSQTIKMQRERLEMEQYYKKQRQEFEDELLALKLCSELNRSRITLGVALMPILILLAITAYFALTLFIYKN